MRPGFSWYWYSWRYGFWFRPFGKRGIKVEWNFPVTFGERYGYTKIYRLGRLTLEFLKEDFRV